VLLFVTEKDDLAALSVIRVDGASGYQHLTAKTMTAFDHVYKHYRNEADWFLKVIRHILMPGFHHSVAVQPLQFRRSVLPFRCAIVTFRCTVAVLPFPLRSYTVAVAGKNGNVENVFPYRDELTKTLIGNGRWQRQRRNEIFHVSNIILTVLT